MDATRIIGALLLIPSIAFAECGFYREDQTMTIIVGKTSNKCFNSEGFKTAFKEDLVASVKAMKTEVEPAPRKIAARRAAKARRLALQEKQQAQSLSTAEYYGQQ